MWRGNYSTPIVGGTIETWETDDLGKLSRA